MLWMRWEQPCKQGMGQGSQAYRCTYGWCRGLTCPWLKPFLQCAGASSLCGEEGGEEGVLRRAGSRRRQCTRSGRDGQTRCGFKDEMCTMVPQNLISHTRSLLCYHI